MNLFILTEHLTNNKENYKHLGILQVGTIKPTDEKKKRRKEALFSYFFFRLILFYLSILAFT